MRMRLFGEEGSRQVLGLEAEVNAWLEQHPDVKIFEIRQSTSGGSMADTKLYISIWYEES